MMGAVKALRDAIDVAGAAVKVPALEKRIAELEERVAALELDAGHAINAIDRGDVADARVVLVSAIKNMFRE